VLAPRSTGRGPAAQDDDGEEEDEFTLIVHPSSSSSKLSAGDSPVKPLWRKRETVRQERTVHYTTIDANGEQQVSARPMLDRVHWFNVLLVGLALLRGAGAGGARDHAERGAAHGVQGDRRVRAPRDHAVRAARDLQRGGARHFFYMRVFYFVCSCARWQRFQHRFDVLCDS
jgi:hypothetical protein